MSDALESEQRNVTAFYELLDAYTEHVIERIDKTASAPSTGTGQDTVERQAKASIVQTAAKNAGGKAAAAMDALNAMIGSDSPDDHIKMLSVG